MTDKIRVVLSGLIFPLTMMHFFWRALERRNDIDLFVTGPFFGNYIPWNNGMELPQKYVKHPDLPLPQGSARLNPDPMIVEAQMPSDKRNPDLWIQVDAGFRFGKRPNARIVAHVQTDPHCLANDYILPRSYSDFNFCMQTVYAKPGDFYLPYAYDVEMHYPEDLEKQYDACLIGLQYKQRNDWVTNLRRNGLNVYYSIGEIYDEYRTKYNQSDIALSWSSQQDLCARNWEALAMGLPLVCNRVPDMKTFFVEGEHYLGFDTLDEAVSQVMRLHNDDDLRFEIGSAGHRKVNGHSWEKRINQILETCKLI